MKNLRIRLATVLLCLLAMSQAHALEYTWATHSDKERLVLNFSQPIPSYTVEHIAPDRVRIHFAQDIWKAEPRPTMPDLSSSQVIARVETAVSSIDISLRMHLSTVRHFTLAKQRKLVLDFPREPLMIHWEDLQALPRPSAMAPKKGHTQALASQKSPAPQNSTPTEGSQNHGPIAAADASTTAQTPGGEAITDIELPAENVELAAVEYHSPQEDFENLSHLVRQYPDDANLHFNMGIAAFSTGRFPLALNAFERALALDSSNGQPLVEMARAHLAMGNPAMASLDLERALQRQLSPQVRSAVELTLDQTRVVPTYRTYRGEFFLGALYDSNIPLAPAGTSLAIGGVELPLPVDSRKQSDTALFAGFALGTTSWAAGSDNRIDISLSHYQKWHQDLDQYDTSYSEIAWGLSQENHQRHHTAAVLRIGHARDDEGTLVNRVILQPRYTFVATPRLATRTDLSFEYRDYRIFDERSSVISRLGQSLRMVRGQHDAHNIAIGFALFHERSDLDTSSNEGWEISLTENYHLGVRSILFANLEYRVASYDEALPGESVREDKATRLQTGIHSQIGKRTALRLLLGYRENSSNVPAYDYRALQGGLSWHLTF